ncbi:hypothetical protein BV210_08020 [Halorientalis sp. IM1011]|uniref:hypothetical protein n=1 Tax=Halorientalis sp. IM1011 TaxID=1932360 RepID=UPI00097CCEF2|nr:hypothetical protein [Halorientalis sp. IM1011]AQL42660.1 hypothetical protein BV210_08020 [Halorientalis sp. IM1011]
MDPRPVFYEHPYASMVTAVFLYSLLVTALYVLDLFPGLRETYLGVTELTLITALLLVATVASWITAMIMSRGAP